MARLAAAPSPSEDSPKKRARVLQSDIPAYTLKQALTVAEALRDQFGKQPASALMLAKALNLSPRSSTFRMLTGAATAYGLTDAGGYADRIGLTERGRRAVAPTEEGDDLAAQREAALSPRIPREFLARYDKNRVPNEKIALNVLEELGVSVDATARALETILENARDYGFLETVKGSQYVTLEGADTRVREPDPEEHRAGAPSAENEVGASTTDPPTERSNREGALVAAPLDTSTNNRVFVSHGKNREIVAQLKEVLAFGGFEPVVSVEIETAAKPVPDKVMDDMRSCSAGIVHVGHELALLDRDGNEHRTLNPNVLIEIGAALALYRGRLILLVEEGAELPSNLQGLYQARFAGGKLDYEATMKLLRIFNGFRQKQ
ncbi:TIR domain-containing protein [Geodermatophilus sp. DSM 45219]|uniref:TIR domain-containing protein n=1 Tax=Geodermatophilus sp. DSM 45219 TaxID=1881103 RepID=UPI0008818DC8|nr:TIR domain-containing protein [Geodermatophilus sp. DSM 45219]SDO68303.1 Predicted nucleotide-binding protein containing TIR-like domain-containing protein [Geodermatophilus sp. DSM 45219]